MRNSRASVGRKDNPELVNRAVDEIADDLAWTGAFGAQGLIDQAAKKYGIPAALRKAVTPKMIRNLQGGVRRLVGIAEGAFS